MDKILSIAWKDIKIRFSRRAEWFLFLILPVVFTIILSGSIGGSADTRVQLLVVDQAGSAFSQQLITELQQSKTVRTDLQSFDLAQSQLDKGQAPAMLVIPPEFDLQHLEIGSIKLVLFQLPNDLRALTAEQAVQSALGPINNMIQAAQYSVRVAEQVHPFTSEIQSQAYFDTSLQQAQLLISQSPLQIAETSRIANQISDYDPVASASAGQLIGWTFVLQLSTSVLFVSERQKGTLRRLQLTPTSRFTLMAGTISGQWVIALAQMVILIGFGVGILRLNWGQDPWALALMIIASSLAAVALGITLGTFVKSERQASSLCVLIGLLMSVLGGISYPLELFPSFIKTISFFVPTHWAMQGLLDIVQRGAGLNAVLPNVAVLLGFGLVFFVIGIRRFRYE